MNLIATILGMLGLGWVGVVFAMNGQSKVVGMITGGSKSGMLFVGLAAASAILLTAGLVGNQRKNAARKAAGN